MLYFTHDYVANAADKNNFLQATAKVAKKHGVEKVVAVCPLESELYYTEDAKTPLEKFNEAQQNALNANGGLTILNTNLVFGKSSYLVHYLTQSVAAGRLPATFANSRY